VAQATRHRLHRSVLPRHALRLRNDLLRGPTAAAVRIDVDACLQ